VYDLGSKRNTTRAAHSNSIPTKTLQHEYQIFSVVDEPENYGEWWGIYQLSVLLVDTLRGGSG